MTRSGSGEGQRRFVAGVGRLRRQRRRLERRADRRGARSGARLIPATAGIVVLAYNVPGLDRSAQASRATSTWTSSRGGSAPGTIRGSAPSTRTSTCRTGTSRSSPARTAAARPSRSPTIWRRSAKAWRDRGPGVGQPRGLARRACWRAATRAWPAGSRCSEDSIGYVEYHFAKRLGPAHGLASEQGRAASSRRASGPARRAGAERVTDARESPPLPARPRRRGRLPDRHVHLAPASYDATPIETRRRRSESSSRWGLTEGQAYSRDLGYIPLRPRSPRCRSPPSTASSEHERVRPSARGRSRAASESRRRGGLAPEPAAALSTRPAASVSATRDPLDDRVVENMLAGYAFVDALVGERIDVLAPGPTAKHLLEMNTLVLCGTSPARREQYAGTSRPPSIASTRSAAAASEDLVEWSCAPRRRRGLGTRRRRVRADAEQAAALHRGQPPHGRARS